MWLTKKSHWLVGKFLQDGFNHVIASSGPILGQTSWYVNGNLIGRLSDSMDFFPFVMPADWIQELCLLESDRPAAAHHVGRT